MEPSSEFAGDLFNATGEHDIFSSYPVDYPSVSSVHYVDNETFPSVLTPFYAVSLLPMLAVAVLLTLYIIWTRTQFHCLENCFAFLSATKTAEDEENEKSSKSKIVPCPPATVIQPVLLPPKDDTVTIKL